MAKKSEPKRSERWGAQYLNAKTGVQLVSPATDAGIGALSGGGLNSLKADIKYRYAGPGLQTTVMGAASSLVQRTLDKKIGQAGALSRNSVTAIIAEAIPVVQTAADKPQTIRAANDSFVRYTSGYSPNHSSFALGDMKEYGLGKYGLGVFRRVVNQTRFAEPVKKVFGMFGGAI